MEIMERAARDVLEVADVHRFVAQKMPSMFPEQLVIRGEVGKCTYDEGWVAFQLHTSSGGDFEESSDLIVYLNGMRYERVVAKCRRVLDSENFVLEELVSCGQPVVIGGRLEYQPEKRRIELRMDDLYPVATIDVLLGEREAARERLVGECLCEVQSERLLPAAPTRVAIIGENSSDSVHTVLQMFEDSPYCLDVTVYDAKPFGNNAIEEVEEAIVEAGLGSPHLVLLVRDAGDPWQYAAFDSEAVGRAVALCDVPVVTGLLASRPCLAEDVAYLRRESAEEVGAFVLQLLATSQEQLARAEAAVVTRAAEGYELARGGYEEVRVAIEAAKIAGDERARQAGASMRRLVALLLFTSFLTVGFLASQTDSFVWGSVLGLVIVGWTLGWLTVGRRDRSDQWCREWRQDFMENVEDSFERALEDLWVIEARLSETTKLQEIETLMEQAAMLGRRCRDLLGAGKRSIENFGG